jgi:hypothetical protein
MVEDETTEIFRRKKAREMRTPRKGQKGAQLMGRGGVAQNRQEVHVTYWSTITVWMYFDADTLNHPSNTNTQFHREFRVS